MSASTVTNKFYPFNLGLSLLSAIPFGIASLYALYLPQSVQAISFAPTQEPSLSSEAETPTLSRDRIFRDRTIPTSELPAEVARIVLENAAKISVLPLDKLQITTVRQVTWSDGCMGVYRPDSACTMALVDGWIVTVESGQQKWVYHTNGSRVLQPNDRTSRPIGERHLPQ